MPVHNVVRWRDDSLLLQKHSGEPQVSILYYEVLQRSVEVQERLKDVTVGLPGLLQPLVGTLCTASLFWLIHQLPLHHHTPYLPKLRPKSGSAADLHLHTCKCAGCSAAGVGRPIRMLYPLILACSQDRQQGPAAVHHAHEQGAWHNAQAEVEREQPFSLLMSGSASILPGCPCLPASGSTLHRCAQKQVFPGGTAQRVASGAAGVPGLQDVYVRTLTHHCCLPPQTLHSKVRSQQEMTAGGMAQRAGRGGAGAKGLQAAFVRTLTRRCCLPPQTLHCVARSQTEVAAGGVAFGLQVFVRFFMRD